MHALYAWPHRHPRLLDGALAVALAALGAGVIAHRPDWLAFGLLTAALVIPVVFRRQRPAAAFGAAAVAGVVQLFTTSGPILPDVSILVLLYTVAAYRPRRMSVPVLAVCLAGALAAIACWAPPGCSTTRP